MTPSTHLLHMDDDKSPEPTQLLPFMSVRDQLRQEDSRAPAMLRTATAQQLRSRQVLDCDPNRQPLKRQRALGSATDATCMTTTSIEHKNALLAPRLQTQRAERQASRSGPVASSPVSQHSSPRRGRRGTVYTGSYHTSHRTIGSRIIRNLFPAQRTIQQLIQTQDARLAGLFQIQTGQHGDGVVATHAIQAGACIVMYGTPSVAPVQGTRNDRTIQAMAAGIPINVELHGLASKVNHSRAPNMRACERDTNAPWLTLEQIQPIAAGDALTFDYGNDFFEGPARRGFSRSEPDHDHLHGRRVGEADRPGPSGTAAPAPAATNPALAWVRVTNFPVLQATADLIDIMRAQQSLGPLGICEVLRSRDGAIILLRMPLPDFALHVIRNQRSLPHARAQQYIPAFTMESPSWAQVTEIRQYASRYSSDWTRFQHVGLHTALDSVPLTDLSDRTMTASAMADLS
eukprot:COSAG01_NODE_13667_length_1551_cov_2.466253_1_plen_458_part_10